MLTIYKNIIWDFDGVIIDSQAIKDYGFTTIFEGHPPGKIDAFLAFHHANGGMTRFVKIRYFFEQLLQQPITEEEVQLLARRFSEITTQLLIKPELLIADSLDFIRQYHTQYRMHIVSASEEQELRLVARTQGIDQYFVSIQGSPTVKKENVQKVLAANQYVLADTCLVGDAINDYEAATLNGIDFYGYNQPKLKGKGAGYIESFAKL